MTKQNTKKYIRTRIQEDTMKNLGIALEALSEVHNEEHYYNHELSNACHELRMKLIPMIQECHDEKNKFKSVLDD